MQEENPVPKNAQTVASMEVCSRSLWLGEASEIYSVQLSSDSSRKLVRFLPRKLVQSEDH